jgi:hypothetical protein
VRNARPATIAIPPFIKPVQAGACDQRFLRHVATWRVLRFHPLDQEGDRSGCGLCPCVRRVACAREVATTPCDRTSMPAGYCETDQPSTVPCRRSLSRSNMASIRSTRCSLGEPLRCNRQPVRNGGG